MPYYIIANNQVELYNIPCSNIKNSVFSSKVVLWNDSHSIRSFLSTATNATPHERFFAFRLHSTHGNPLPL